MAEQVNVSKVADDSVLLIEMDDGKANALSSPMIDATAIEEAAGLAVLDGTAYRRTMAGFRRPTLERMADQIAADRAAAGSR